MSARVDPGTLPPSLSGIDPPPWSQLDPEELLLRPDLLAGQPPDAAAANALVYGRAGGDGYDEIGFRTAAATPRPGPSPLQTSVGAARDAARRSASLLEESVARILRDEQKLRHRPLDLPRDDGSVGYRFEIARDEVRLFRTLESPDGGASEDLWTFALSDPPPFLLQQTSDQPARLTATQAYRLDLPGAFWLPLPQLIAAGRFPRFQEGRDQLVRETRPGALFLFVSHRWLSPDRPDPDNLQARFAAWQLVAAVCEAVRVAQRRGLGVPRRHSTLLGCPIGAAGSELAEAILGNVLEPDVDAKALERLAAEARSLETRVADRGVAAARDDRRLAGLREALAERPGLGSLLGSIYLWYDYSCVPQAPRDEADEGLFRDALEHLLVFQVLGRTVVLLDDPQDYLTRAWCTLEALVADTEMGELDLLVGAHRATLEEGLVEKHFDDLLADRPHLVWRGVLDGELFRVQDEVTCMRRLGLAATKPEDIPFIYASLCRTRGPVKIHTDDSELVTGVFPLPRVDGDRLALPPGAGRAIAAAGDPEPRRESLDWSDCLRLPRLRDDGARTGAVPPWHDLAPGAAENGCHIAVVGGCEAEACLFASWVLERITELEALLVRPATSLSWLSTDIAPVGHLPCGTLEATPVAAGVWVVVSLSIRLERCQVTGMLLETLRIEGIPYATLALDESENNFAFPAPSAGASTDERRLSEGTSCPRHRGGLFRWALLEHLT